MTDARRKAREEKQADALPPATPLFPGFEPGKLAKVRRYKRIQQPIWTENKAQFIRKYLRYFVQITKHGVYIDGFAGPQSFSHLDAWTAKLVLESEPKWLRHFFLCEIKRRGIRELKKLAELQANARDRKGRKINRKIEVIQGDFNQCVEGILSDGGITQKEATFCLLDQRTFECHWATVEQLATYKRPPQNKIELLYLLGVGWIHRAFSGIRNTKKVSQWWGKPDWETLKEMTSWNMAELVRVRFEKELGYRFAAAYPIFDRNEGNRVMYYMIHGSDHEEAPALMVRAHSGAVRSLPPSAQPLLNF